MFGIRAFAVLSFSAFFAGGTAYTATSTARKVSPSVRVSESDVASSADKRMEKKKKPKLTPEPTAFALPVMNGKKSKKSKKDKVAPAKPAPAKDGRFSWESDAPERKPARVEVRPAPKRYPLGTPRAETVKLSPKASTPTAKAVPSPKVKTPTAKATPSPKVKAPRTATSKAPTAASSPTARPLKASTHVGS